MFGLIMVPVDGSDFSERAVDRAIALAEHANAAVHLTLVHEPMPTWAASPSAGPLEDQARQGEQAYLDALIEKTREQTSVAITGDIIGAPGASAFEEHAVKKGFSDQLLNRPVAAALALHAEERRADIVVMSTHGRGAIRRLWLGSVAEQLVWQMHIPVLLVKPEQEDGKRWSREFKHILLPLDTSAQSEAMIDTAIDFGKPFGAKFTILQVQGEPFAYGGILPQLSPEAVTTLVNDQVASVRTYLDGIVARFADAGLEAEAVTVASDSPTGGILQVAEDRDVDLIALSTHGGGVKNLLMGSVTARVVQRAEVPILVVTPKRG